MLSGALMDSRSFDSKRIALGYAKRPWLHNEVIERVKRDCGPQIRKRGKV
jgi:hypothetical protein